MPGPSHWQNLSLIVVMSGKPGSFDIERLLRRAARAAAAGDTTSGTEALAAARAAAAEDLDCARVHVGAAEFHNLTGDRPSAQANAQAALELLAGSPGEIELLARAAAELGTAQWFLRKDPAAAEPHYRRARELVADAPEMPVVRRLQIIDDFALCLQNTGQPEPAEALYAEVAAGAEAAGLHALGRRARRRQGTLLMDTARFAEAEAALRSSRPPSRAGSSERFDWHHAMALLGEKTNRFLLAERHYDAAVAAFVEQPLANADRVGGLVNAAILKLMLGWTDVAGHLLDLAETSAAANPPAGFAFTYPAARAALLAERGDLTGGVATMEDAADTAIAAFPSQHAYYLAFYIYAAELLIADNRLAEAAKLLRRGLGKAAPDLGQLPPDAAVAAFILAETELASGTPSGDASALLRSRGRLFFAGLGEEGTWRALAAFADFAAQGGDMRRAIAYGKLAAVRGSEWAVVGGMRSLEQPGGPARLYRVLERLTGALAATHRLVEARACRSLVRDLTSFPGRRARPWALEFTDAEASIVADVDAALRALQADPALLQDLAPLPAFDRLLALEAHSPTPIRQAFAAAAEGAVAGRTAVLRYYVEAYPLLLEVESGGRRTPIELPATTGELANLAADLIDTMLADGHWQPQSRKLYDALLRPALPYLGNVDELQIVAGPLLGELPFAALSDGANFLVDRFALAFRSGEQVRRRQPRPLRIAAFGSLVGEPGADRLRFVPREAASIRSVFPTTATRVGHRFTGEALRTALAAGFSVVHIAGHFHLVPGSPYRSRLYLGSGQPLTVAEFTSADFDWSGVDLVFLSGCETGTDDLLMDDRRTLAATLHERGVLAVVASQWPADDRASVALVTAFYRALKTGIAPAGALAQAQRAVMAPAAGVPVLGTSQPTPDRTARHWAGYRVMIPGE